MTTLVIGAAFLIGASLGAWIQAGQAAMYRRRWKEAVALLIRMDEVNGSGRFRIPPSLYATLYRHMRSERHRHVARRDG